MGKGNRNRIIRKEALRAATEAGQPGRAESVAKRSRKDLKELKRKGLRIRFEKLKGGGVRRGNDRGTG